MFLNPKLQFREKPSLKFAAGSKSPAPPTI